MWGNPAVSEELDKGSDPLTPPTGSDQRLSRGQRLTRPAQFRETYGQQHKRVGRHMVLWLRKGEDTSLRLGVVASRKVGNAVARTRARRLLRELYRRNRFRFSGDYDVVLVARGLILKAKWEDLVNELLDLAERSGLEVQRETQ